MFQSTLLRLSKDDSIQSALVTSLSCSVKYDNIQNKNAHSEATAASPTHDCKTALFSIDDNTMKEDDPPRIFSNVTPRQHKVPSLSRSIALLTCLINVQYSSYSNHTEIKKFSIPLHSKI